MAGQRALVYGGKGALGAAIVKAFKSKNIWVCSVDLAPNEEADANVIVTELSDWCSQDKQVQDHVAEVLSGEKLDGIFCVAGGWAGGNASSKELVKSADMMWKQSVWSSIVSGSLAAQHLKENGVLQLTGAVPALKETPGMIGYGMAKAAVHQLTRSLGSADGGLPSSATVTAILPVTLDTPMNRKFMPDADQTTWTPLEFIAEKFCDWLNKKDLPKTGTLWKLITKDNNTTIVQVDE